MEVINVPVRDLIPYEKNAKNHPDDQVEHIANSIREFGFRQPLVIDAQNVVVIGHGRLMAAKKLGMDEVPCVRADDLSEAQIKALRLADNKTNESEWDFDALEQELDELSVEFDMSDFGFDDIQVVESVESDAHEKDKSIRYFDEKEIEQAIIDDWQSYESARAFADLAIDRASAMFQFNRLCQGYDDGYNISLLFNPHRFDVETKKNKSILYGWNNDSNYRKQFARYIVEVAERVPPKSEFYKMVGIGTAGYQYVNEFQPYMARDIYKRFVSEGGRILNPCAGWGGRLLGYAACMFHDVEYVETDPSTETYKGLVALKRFLRLGDKVKQYNLPFEELEVEKDYFDFVFTSPPYFDTERYADEETQSYLRYGDYENWRDSFLYPMIDKILYCMKPDGKCLLNVGHAIYDIDTAIEQYLDKLSIRHSRISDFKIGGAGIGDRTGEGGEPFILFSKE